MALSCACNYFTLLTCFVLNGLTLRAYPISSTALRSLTLSGHPNFDPDVALFGDAEVVDADSYVNLTRPTVSSSGFLIRRTPVRFVPTVPRQPRSFSTEVSFSISPEHGDGFVFAFVSSDFFPKFPGNDSFGLSSGKRFLGIEFDTSMEDNVGDLNANHVGIDVGSLVSVTSGNVSSLDLVLNNGQKLKTWIDYDASSKRLEVRLSRFSEPRPLNPFMAYSIDLSAMWGDEDVFVAICSSNGNSFQISTIYSWRFRFRVFPTWMHSLPVDPRGHSNEKFRHAVDHQNENGKVHSALLAFLACLIKWTGCAALMTFVVLFLWVITVGRRSGTTLNSAEFRYEKMNVVVKKGNHNTYTKNSVCKTLEV